jgi:hypothetical protein
VGGVGEEEGAGEYDRGEQNTNLHGRLLRCDVVMRGRIRGG